MWRSLAVPMSACFLVLTFAGPVKAQLHPRLRVAVNIHDTLTGGLFQSAFSSAFRRLGDVDVVDASEYPQFALNGVIVCDGDCRTAQQYAVALELAEPISDSLLAETVREAARVGVSGTVEQKAEDADFVSIYLGLRLGGIESRQSMWGALWGRQVYEEAVLEFVRKLDSECLDRVRAWDRLGPRPDSTSLANWQREDSAAVWICRPIFEHLKH